MMNYRKTIKENNANHISIYQHVELLIETVSFLIEKVSQLYQCKYQNENSQKKKSMIKLFDKNIDNIANIRNEVLIQVPHFDQFTKISERLQIYHSSLPQLANNRNDEDINTAEVTSHLFHLEQRLDKQDIRYDSLQHRTQCLQSDFIQLIKLYKDNL